VLGRLKAPPRVENDPVADDLSGEEYILMGTRRTVNVTVSRDNRSRISQGT
jgi:hypothetical protein